MFKDYGYHFVELTQIFRQDESEVRFKKLLDDIRINKITDEDISLLNSRHRSKVNVPKTATFLTSLRRTAANINKKKLDELTTKEYMFEGELTGKYEKFADSQMSKRFIYGSNSLLFCK